KVFVADTFNSAIRVILADGTVTTLAGQAGSYGNADGKGFASRFGSPSGLGMDAAGNLYVADTGNNTIRKVTPSGLVSTLAGQRLYNQGPDGTGTYARFSRPAG